MKKVIVIAVALIVLTLAFIAGAQYMKAQTPTETQIPIDQIVAATLSAMPTITPYPTAEPTATALTLNGLFCEYDFCIGHPEQINFFDANVVRNQASPNSKDYGILVGYAVPNLFMQVTWTLFNGTDDAQAMFKYALQDGDTLSGSLDVQLVGNLNVYYQPLTTSVSSTLPFGGVAAWTCGGRVFTWKTYTPQDGMAPDLLKESLAKFDCGK